MHLIYTVLAMLLVGILSLSVMRTSTNAQQRMVTNEIMTQVTGVADEVFDHAAGYWFDERVDERDWAPQPPTFPLVTLSTIGTLTPMSAASTGPTSDGWGGCTPAQVYTADLNMNQPRLQNSARPETCDDLDDLHGLSLNLERDGLNYTVDVAVQYVDALNPLLPSSSQTFAKEIELTIATPDYTVGGSPLEVTLRQVFVYERITEPLTSP